MKIRRLRQVFIATDDLEGRIPFYQQVLGLQLQFRDGDRWAQFQAGDLSIALASRQESMGAPLDVPVPVLEVDDLDGALDELRSEGREIGDVRDMGSHGRAVPVRDPSGAFLVLFAKASPSK
jgi:predicted enzyme related to lactoylglutathione lyase